MHENSILKVRGVRIKKSRAKKEGMVFIFPISKYFNFMFFTFQYNKYVKESRRGGEEARQVFTKWLNISLCLLRHNHFKGLL